jgi:hypothetical protein
MKKTRVVNLRHEPYDVYIGRGSSFGNQWTHIKTKPTKAKYTVNTVEEAISEYQNWILQQPELLARVRHELNGQTLGCYCKPGPCHGDILVKICNGEL